MFNKNEASKFFGSRGFGQLFGEVAPKSMGGPLLHATVRSCDDSSTYATYGLSALFRQEYAISKLTIQAISDQINLTP